MIKAGEELITLTDPNAPASEAYRALRTNIMMRNFDREMQVINVISCTKEEGKSTCVLNLAVVYAQLQKKVLVIDLDLRLPSIHKKLKIKNRKGITDLISKQVSFEEAVQTPIDNIDVITAGTKTPFASEFLQSHALQQFIKSKRSSYDLILLDCAPIGLVTDGMIVSKMCDGTVFVVSSNVNERKDLVRAKEELEQMEVNVIGLVMTQMPTENRYYRYYGNYGSAKTHGHKKSFFRKEKK